MTESTEVLTTGQAGKVCNVAPQTVSKWLDTGLLHGYRIPGGKHRRIPLVHLIEFMRRYGIPLSGLDRHYHKVNHKSRDGNGRAAATGDGI